MAQPQSKGRGFLSCDSVDSRFGRSGGKALIVLQPITIVVSRQAIEAGNTSEALSALGLCLASVEKALELFENVDVAFHGYDRDQRELWEKGPELFTPRIFPDIRVMVIGAPVTEPARPAACPFTGIVVA